MKTGRALEAYIRARPNVRIPIDKLVSDLELGEADLGTRPQQNVKITLSAYRWLLQFDPSTYDVWLAPTANDERPKRRRSKEKLTE
jgi:hypothetical protein